MPLVFVVAWTIFVRVALVKSDWTPEISLALVSEVDETCDDAAAGCNLSLRQLRATRQQGVETALMPSGSPSTAVSLMRSSTCLEAKELTCSDITSVGLMVSWPSVPNATAYLLQIARRLPNTSKWMPVLTANAIAPCSNVQDLLPGSEYQFSIQAVSSKWPDVWQPWKTYGKPVSCRTSELAVSQAWVLPPNETSSTSILVRFKTPAEIIGLTEFQVHWNGASSGSIMVKSSPLAIITGLPPASVFAVHVTPIYGKAQGKPSDVVLYRTRNQSVSWFYAYRGSYKGDKGGYLAQVNAIDRKSVV